MDRNSIHDLTEFFRGYVSLHKQELFEQVLNQRTRYLAVALEDIVNTQNASAVVRTCECMGVQDVHVIEKEHDYVIHKDIVMGASKWLNLYLYKSSMYPSKEILSTMRSRGYKIVVTTPNEKASSPETIDLSQPLALFFGTEQTGLSQEIIENADEELSIPMVGFTESLNISVSVGIILNILCHRMRRENINFGLSEDEKDELRLEWYKKMTRNSQLLERRFFEDR